jgi:hypothetical protein
MTPQLFINYKLKSVAHMPWRAMVYKFLNTFIDDLFAFIIKMPTMHRISVFRDGACGRAPALLCALFRRCRWVSRVRGEHQWDRMRAPADIIFFIYIYQRRVYRVDATRKNEFGTSAEVRCFSRFDVLAARRVARAAVGGLVG